MIYITIIALFFGSIKSCPKNGELSNDGTCYFFAATCFEQSEPIRDEHEFAMVSRLKRGKSKLGRSKVCISVEHRFFDLLVNQNEPRFLRELRENGAVYFEKNVEPGDSVYMGFRIKNSSEPASITLHNSIDNINYPARIEIFTKTSELILSSNHKTVLDQSTAPFEPSSDAYYQFEIILSKTDFEIVDTLKGRAIKRFKLGSGSADMLKIENIEIWQIEHNLALCISGGTYGKVTKIAHGPTPEVEFERELLHNYTVNSEDTGGYDVSIGALDHETRNLRFHLIGELKLMIHLSKEMENGRTQTMLTYFVHSGEYVKTDTCYESLVEKGEKAKSSNGYTFTIEARKNQLHILIQSSSNHQQTKQFTSTCTLKMKCPKIDNIEDCFDYYNHINLKSTESFVAAIRHLPPNTYKAEYCFSDYLDDQQLAPNVPYNDACSRTKPLMLCKIREPVVGGASRRRLGGSGTRVEENEEMERFIVAGNGDILEANRAIVITLSLLTSTSVLFTLLNCVIEKFFVRK